MSTPLQTCSLPDSTDTSPGISLDTCPSTGPATSPATSPKGQAYHNIVEPPAFANLFMRHPPIDFACTPNALGLPVFCTKFNLLTTLEAPARARLARLPLFRYWSKLLCLQTSFVGSTITEYLPLPQNYSPKEILQYVVQAHCQKHRNRKCEDRCKSQCEAQGEAQCKAQDKVHDKVQSKASSLTIFKDLPSASPLLNEQSNQFSCELTRLALAKGFINLEGQALAYVDLNFTSLDEYLAKFSSSRRKDMRRKLKKRELLEIEVISLGDAAFNSPELLETMYNLYLQVFRQSEVHFDLLSKDFFRALLQSQQINGLVVFYRHAGSIAGYNICLVNEDALIDKYVGFNYPLARELNLYFISWFYNLELALGLGLKKYIAGWTDPEVKKNLGASFTLTHHMVYVKNPLLRAILRPLKGFFESDSKNI